MAVPAGPLALAVLLAAAPAPCPCPAGIGASEGDAPILRAAAGAVDLAVCGFRERSLADGRVEASELEVVRCDSRKVLLQLGARSRALVGAVPGGLAVTEVVSLPAGPGGSRIDLAVRRHEVSEEGGRVVARSRVVLVRPAVEKAVLDRTSARYRKALRSRSAGSELVEEMLVAALSGSGDWERRYRAFPHEVAVEGDVAETYQEGLALLDLLARR